MDDTAASPIAGMTQEELWKIVDEFEKRVRNRFHVDPYDSTCGFSEIDLQRYLHAVVAIDRPYHYTTNPTNVFQHIFRSGFPVAAWKETVFQILDQCDRRGDGQFYSTSESFYTVNGEEVRSGHYDPKFALVQEACQEHPELFADRLDRIFYVGISFYDPMNMIMWERHGERHRSFLKEHITATQKSYEQSRTLIHLLWMNTPESIADVEKFLRELPESDEKGWISADIMNGGYIYEDDTLKPLYSRRPYHIIFPKDYLLEDHIENEPSFQPLHPQPGTYRFGGTVEGMTTSGREVLLDHIITFDPVPEFLPVTGLQRLVIAASLSAVHYDGDWNYYRHTTGGLVIADEEALAVRAQEEALPIQETEVLLSDQGEEYRIQGWEGYKNLYRVGGPPGFVQGDNYATCPNCQRLMPQLMQLDSSLPRTDGNSNDWGSGGLAHINWCDNCKISSIWWECS